MAVSAEEVDKYTGNPINNKSSAIYLDSGAPEHYFDNVPWLRGRLSDYEILEEPREITTIVETNTSWKEMLPASSPVLLSTKRE